MIADSGVDGPGSWITPDNLSQSVFFKVSVGTGSGLGVDIRSSESGEVASA